MEKSDGQSCPTDPGVSWWKKNGRLVVVAVSTLLVSSGAHFWLLDGYDPFNNARLRPFFLANVVLSASLIIPVTRFLIYAVPERRDDIASTILRWINSDWQDVSSVSPDQRLTFFRTYLGRFHRRLLPRYDEITGCGKPNILAREVYAEWLDKTVKVKLHKLFCDLEALSGVRYVAPFALYIVTVIFLAAVVTTTACAITPGTLSSIYTDTGIKNVADAFGLQPPTWKDLLAVTGAYLYTILNLSMKYRARSLVSTDLVVAGAHLIAALFLAATFSDFTPSWASSIVAFGVGALSPDAIRVLSATMLRRAVNANTRIEADSELLSRLDGVTRDMVRDLMSAGIQSIQQLQGFDPVELSVRTGFPLVFVISLVSQSHAWSLLGPTTSRLAKFGLGGTRAIARFNKLRRNGDPNALAAMPEIAKKLKWSISLVEYNFDRVSDDEYTKFLNLFTSVGEAEHPNKPENQAHFS